MSPDTTGVVAKAIKARTHVYPGLKIENQIISNYECLHLAVNIFKTRSHGATLRATLRAT